MESTVKMAELKLHLWWGDSVNDCGSGTPHTPLHPEFLTLSSSVNKLISDKMDDSDFTLQNSVSFFFFNILLFEK